MATEPPAAPPSAAVPQPTAAPAKPSGGRGCFGCGCGGCLVIVVLVVLLVGGGGWWFFIVQASAAVTAPASLVVINQPITVDSHPGTPGELINAGNTVATGETGHGAIDFPDGSYLRMAPNTTVQVTNIQLQKNGNLQAIELQEKVGRTFVNVAHLANGASFKVDGHSVSAAVRGTQFEILVRPDHTNRIWVFVGVVTVTGKTTATLTAGQEIDADANGNFTNRRANQFDPTDPFPLAAQCSAATTGGTTAGTMDAADGQTLTGGQSAENDYYSPGGNLTIALCYPGSLMSVTVTDPNGTTTTRQASSPVKFTIPNGPPGIYKAVVSAVSVPASGEAYSVVFATDAPCTPGSVDTGGVVRETLSNSQISTALAESGSSGVTLYVQGASPTSARLVYYSDLNGVQVSWTIDFYAATPDLGAVITQVTVHGVNVTTQVISNLSSISGSVTAIPAGFVVDRVYSCAGPNGDNMMVVEGHR